MIIYKITNLINNKIYIGKSIKNDPNYFGSGLLINKSIKKYGIENFKKDIIDESISSINDLNEKEKFWIKYFNSIDLNIGYNIAYGGDGGDLITNNPNKEHFLEYCRNRKGIKNGMFGKKHNQNSIEKMSINRKGKHKGIKSWNKGLTKKDYSKEYRYNVEHQKRGFFCKNKKTYIIFSPNKIMFEVYGSLIKFCDENKLPFLIMRTFINKGEIPHPKKGKPKDNRINLIGWEIRTVKYHKKMDKNFIPQETRQKLKEKLKERSSGENNINAKTFYLISPQNETFEVKGQLPTFCKNHNINYYVIKRWINKGEILPSIIKNDEIRKNTNGWEIKTDINIKIENNRTYYILKSPNNIKYKIFGGVKNFCKEHNIWYETLIDNINKGKIKEPIRSFTQERINTTGWEIIKNNSLTIE